MLCGRTIWLAINQSSGSHDDEAVAALEHALAAAEARLHHKVCIPHDVAPNAATLGGEAVDVLAIFTGDGTISSIVTGLYGWSGAVLVLPGGTMNLLSRQLHGEADASEIIARVAEGKARRVRPAIVRTAQGDGLSGMLAGPGTVWNDVREAMRDSDVVGMVKTVSGAIAESTGGGMVVCRAPVSGRDEGYTAIMLSPCEDGIALEGFYADGAGDYLKQGLALVRRNFRDGPSEPLGTHRRVRLGSVDGAPIGLLIDGEPFDAGPEATFDLARCEVDLIATSGDRTADAPTSP